MPAGSFASMNDLKKCGEVKGDVEPSRDWSPDTTGSGELSACTGVSKKPRIYETIVVEGRDDAAVVKQVVDADIVITHGFGLSKEARARILRASEVRDSKGRGGVVVLTDPDFAGEQIRKQVDRIISGAIHVRLSRVDAMQGGDIGIENADPRVVLEAFRRSGLLEEMPDDFGDDTKAKFCEQNENGPRVDKGNKGPEGDAVEKLSTVIHRSVDKSEEASEPLKTAVSTADLMRLGLVGDGSKPLKIKVCRVLGLGDCNTKRFLERLRLKGVSLEQLEALVDNSVDK